MNTTIHSRDEFSRRLLDERDRLLRALTATDEELAALAASPRRDVSATGAATEILSRLDWRERHELAEIDAALARIAAGTYGLCEACEAEIPLARLRALPTTRHCRDCQGQHER